jgi:hypothetical protein
MAKRKAKEKTQLEIDAIEAERIAAYEVVELPPTEAGLEIIERALAESNQPEELQPEDVEQLEEELAEQESEEKVPNSIVKDKFKNKYIENANLIGDKRKQVKRSNWDWLAQNLATFCLNDKGKIDIGAFTDILDANGVDHSRWTNRNRGWEGRFRMTGRVALQKAVANSGTLKWPDGSEMEAPAEFIDKYKTKA